MKKKLFTLLCAMLLAFSMPTVAFSEEGENNSGGIETHVDVEDSDLAGKDLTPDGKGNLIYTCANANLSWNGVTAGTIISMTMTVNNGENGGFGVGYPTSTNVSAPYDIDDSETVLSAVGFKIRFAGDTLDEAPDGGNMEFTYQVNEKLVNDLATENGIQASDIKLFVYEKERSGNIDTLVSDWNTADIAQVNTNNTLKAGTFVMALAADTDVLNAAKAKPKPEPSSSTESDSSSSSDSDSGYIPYVHPTATPLVATGKDVSTSSPKTGQPIPSETAPIALVAAIALGASAFLAARKRTR